MQWRGGEGWGGKDNAGEMRRDRGLARRFGSELPWGSDCRALSTSCAGLPAVSGSILFPALTASAIPSLSAMSSKGLPENGPRIDFAEVAPADACHLDRWPVRRSRLGFRG